MKNTTVKKAVLVKNQLPSDMYTNQAKLLRSPQLACLGYLRFIIKFSRFFSFFITSFYAMFLCGHYNIFKKVLTFLPLKKWKYALKSCSLVAQNCSFSAVPAAQTTHKQKLCTTISPLMQDWVFRLGPYPFWSKHIFPPVEKGTFLKVFELPSEGTCI